MLLVVFLTVFICGHMTRCENDVPYTVEIENFEISTEYGQKYVNWDTLGLKRKARNLFVVGGTFYLNRNLADEQKIVIQVYPYYKDKHVKGPLVFKIEKEICKFIKEDQKIYPSLREKSNFPEPGTCPVPKNEYTIDDYEMQADFLPHDILRGDYFIVFLLKDRLSAVAGFTAIANISD